MKQNIEFKDKIVLISWVAGLLIIISVFWILTQSVQTRYLMRAVNNIFISNDNSYRITEYIPKKSSNASSLGYWYSLYNSDDFLFVFTVFQDGILIPLGAIVTPDNHVIEILPLSAHAQHVFEKIPSSILELYANRIEMEGLK